jgi:hypothetical protein
LATAACGGQIRGSAESPDASPGTSQDASADVTTGCSTGTTGTASGDGSAPYTGSVVASWSNSTQLLSAGFPYFGGFPAAGNGTTCHCASGIADPAPSRSAGTITVQAGPCGPVVASLSFGDDSGFPEYTQESVSWTPGDALAVSAAGDPSQVHAFAGTLQTGIPLSGLSPAIGPSAQNIVVPLDQPLVLSWTPEGRSGETVDVYIRQVTPTSVVSCGCVAPDSAGTMTFPSALLSQHFVPTTTKTTATATVARTIDTLTSADDAVVHLVGVVSVGGPVLLE